MLTFSASLHFSRESEERVLSLVRALAAATGNAYRLLVPTHLTLGMFRAENENALESAFSKAGKEFSETGLKFNRLETFRNKVLLLAPDEKSAAFLKSLNAAIHATALPCAPAANGGRYLPDRFFPHITLASGLSPSQFNAALDFSRSLELPLSVRATKIVLAQTKPYRVVGEVLSNPPEIFR